jgi:hypothetical protein
LIIPIIFGEEYYKLWSSSMTQKERTI